jgi:26S proteasome regulatory subunit N2
MKSLIMSQRCKQNISHAEINQIFCSEAYVDDPAFPQKDLAASLASKVFYYLEEYEEALRLALEAGDRFDLNERSQYVETLVHKCIDKYIEKRVAIVDKKEEGIEIDAKMENVITKMFERCYQDH